MKKEKEKRNHIYRTIPYNNFPKFPEFGTNFNANSNLSQQQHQHQQSYQQHPPYSSHQYQPQPASNYKLQSTGSPSMAILSHSLQVSGFVMCEKYGYRFVEDISDIKENVTVLWQNKLLRSVYKE